MNADPAIQPGERSTLRIGEAARLLGMTTECIRYYEYQGLIRARKEEKSGYRFYDRNNIRELVNIQFMRKLGFGIAQIKHIAAADNRAQIMDMIAEEKKGILENIRQKQLLLAKLDEMERVSGLVETEQGSCSIRPSPAFFIMAEIPGGSLLALKGSHIFCGGIGDFCTFGGVSTLDGDRWIAGKEYVLLQRKFAANLNIGESFFDLNDKVIKSKRCGYTVCRIGPERDFHPVITELLLWIRGGGYCNTSDPMFNHLLTISGENGIEEYFEVFIPIV